MSGKSPIQWTEKSWNVTVGCTRVIRRTAEGKPIPGGCDHCYAFALHDKRHVAYKGGNWPSAPAQYHLPFSRVQVLEARLLDPFSWRDGARVFVNSMSDAWHDDIPDEVIAQMFGVMALTPRHTYQILTKRPQRMRDWMKRYNGTDCVAAFMHSNMGRAIYGTRTWRYNIRKGGREQRPWPLDNVWLGTSVEDQRAAEERIPLLAETPAAVRFLSMEPLLERVDIDYWLGLEAIVPDYPWEPITYEQVQPSQLDWVIVGGESGKHARDFAWEWIPLEECRAAGVPIFVKQLGSMWAKKHHAKDHHGGDMSEWREHLRVREYPAAVAEQREARS